MRSQLTKHCSITEGRPTLVLILVNCPACASVGLIADSLLDQWLAASCYRYCVIASRYCWKGRMIERFETPLLNKTQIARPDAVEQVARALYPNDVAAIIRIPARAEGDYAVGLRAETRVG